MDSKPMWFYENTFLVAQGNEYQVLGPWLFCTYEALAMSTTLSVILLFCDQICLDRTLMTHRLQHCTVIRSKADAESIGPP